MTDYEELKEKLEQTEALSDLQRIEGRIQGIQFVLDNLCSCETCHKGRPWMKNMINELTERLNKLKDERTGIT